MQNNTNLIFDFDGTLADSYFLVIEKFNLLAEEFNFCKITANENNVLKELASSELLKYLQIPLYKLPLVLARARALMRTEIQRILPFPEIKNTLAMLHHQGFKMSILTSNSIDNVSKWLQQNNMENYFGSIHAKASFLGKVYSLRKLIKVNKMDKSKTFYIGDETRDIESSNKCGIQSIAVTWGFNSANVLAQYQPDFIVKNPENILDIVSR